MITLCCEREGTKVTFELPDDMGMPELFRELRTFCLAIQFHPDTVDQYFPEEE